MKSDTLFYHLFQEFPGIFFELIGRKGQEAEGYSFASVEIKQPTFRIDGAFYPISAEKLTPFTSWRCSFRRIRVCMPGYARKCSSTCISERWMHNGAGW